jgi:DNA-binding transcriptional MocR family regulator
LLLSTNESPLLIPIGLPNNNYFPFDTLEGTAALPNRFTPTPNELVDLTALQKPHNTSDSSASSRVMVPKAVEDDSIVQKIDLKTALQYGTAQGYPPLHSFLRQFSREHLHPNVPYEQGPEIILTTGNTDGFAKTIATLSNLWSPDMPIEEKEGLLVEEFAYMNAIQAARPRGMNIVPVALDDEGMMASGKGGLEDVLQNWDEQRGKRPHLIYTVTIGQNPTSGTLGVSRRKEIYALCVKYDIIIIEDDPYWYLQFPSANASSIAARGHPTSVDAQPGQRNYNTPKSSGYAFLDSLVPSYLSVDTEGRVVRLDTFSKTVAPGCRLGWITTQPALAERILRITETSTQQPSGFVQSLIAELLIGPQSSKDGGRGGEKDGSGWQMDGWVRWLEGLRGNYERRMQVMCTVLEKGKYLIKSGRRQSISSLSSDWEEWGVVEKTLMYDFAWPLGGMFIWVKINFQSHPLLKKVEHGKLAQALWFYLTTEKYKVLVSPGTIFSPTDEIREERGWAYFRLCFAAVDEDDVEKVSVRFVEGMKSFWGKKKLDEELGGLEALF